MQSRQLSSDKAAGLFFPDFDTKELRDVTANGNPISIELSSEMS